MLGQLPKWAVLALLFYALVLPLSVLATLMATFIASTSKNRTFNGYRYRADKTEENG
jgi:hypothetical protein